jgi:hypothetical protein
LVGSLGFFFGNRNHIYKLYKEFFGVEDEESSNDNKGLEDDAEDDTKGSSSRFYFTLTYQLAKEDVTKFSEVENTNLYLCLNTASLMKEQADRQKEEIRKMEKKSQMK